MLKDVLLECYNGDSDDNVFEQLVVLRQDESIEEYIEEFERLIS